MGHRVFRVVQLDWDTVSMTSKIPTATYRIQLNAQFTFADLQAILPYLRDLGVSHIYASPIFQAKSASSHGYDVVDPSTINPELGGKAAFERLLREVGACGLGWLQDIVPNHASYSLENPWVYDVLEKGVESRFSGYFDVDWAYSAKQLRGKILAPFLAESYIKSLKEGKLSLIHNGSFKVKYDNTEFPLNAKTQQHLNSAPIPQTLTQYNKNPKLLHQLLQNQNYLLTHWKTAFWHLNYRRFFDIIDLIGMHMENPFAFEDTHRLIFELTKGGCVSGLRVDHIDGLYEPTEYLQKLRLRLPETYLVVEKILTGNEQLPASWSVEGTTGYDFLNYVNAVFVQTKGEQEIDAFYRQFTGNLQTFHDTVYACKKAAIAGSFLGDVANLARLFSQTLCSLGIEEVFSRDVLRAAVVELLACFPIYRTYLDKQNPDAAALIEALDRAKQKDPQLSAEFAAFVWLLQKCSTSPAALHALMRLQQYTGAVMAKGFEDTALYRYCRLLSLNEVGGDPSKFGISLETFHAFISQRQQHWPHTLNASSTHDTKRGEDLRARLNVLSEIPDEFKTNAEKWAGLAVPLKQVVSDEVPPDRNVEYFLYQTLLGAYPWNPIDQVEFQNRLTQYLVKALREAKRHSNWIAPNLPYEAATTAYVTQLLNNTAFLDAFHAFQRKVAFYGVFNSLSQTLLKIACPGVPDFYQGTELWDLNLVDPDNRRPINYPTRQTLLREINQLEPHKSPKLLDKPDTGKVKFYVIYRALELRQKLKSLFEEGDYIPLRVRGFCAANVVAFCRHRGDCYVVVLASRFLTELLAADAAWREEVDWVDTYVSLPDGAPTRWTDALTAQIVPSQCGRLPLREVLGELPVAMLFGSDSNG
ncbi:MAG: malto-oligosyltrehalose synthase [Candidatus Bathyarchaeota archaeon]|nr:malto-oligosyltrehalose synthase [Candidatus Bathyarchaeota archaeon]